MLRLITLMWVLEYDFSGETDMEQ